MKSYTTALNSDDCAFRAQAVGLHLKIGTFGGEADDTGLPANIRICRELQQKRGQIVDRERPITHIARTQPRIDFDNANRGWRIVPDTEITSRSAPM